MLLFETGAAERGVGSEIAVEARGVVVIANVEKGLEVVSL